MRILIATLNGAILVHASDSDMCVWICPFGNLTPRGRWAFHPRDNAPSSAPNHTFCNGKPDVLGWVNVRVGVAYFWRI